MSALTGTRFTVVARLSDETVLHVGSRVGAEEPVRRPGFLFRSISMISSPQIVPLPVPFHRYNGLGKS